MNLFLEIFVCYVLIGIFLVAFTRVRSQIISENKDAKNITGGAAPLCKVLSLITILFVLGVFLWPLFLSAWFRKQNILYEVIKKDLPARDVPMPMPTIEELNLQRAQCEKANALITIADAAFPFPQRFKFEIGGFHGSAHQLRLVGLGELEYKFAANAYQWWKPPIILKPDHTHWEEFWREMDAVNFWHWHPEYRTHCCDGTHWSFCTRISDKSQQTMGSNGYPGSEDSFYPRGGQFDLFLKAMQNLTGVEKIC
jgi:hypothetical protein